MKSKTIKIIILFTAISIAALLLILWLIDFSPFNLPEFIPGLEVRTYGILILAVFILVYFFLQKVLLRSDPKMSVLKLVIASTVVGFVSLFIYQAIRQFIILHGQYSYDLSSVLVSSAVPTVILIIMAASIALELKKTKGILRHVPTIILLILFLLTKQYWGQFEW